MGILGVYVLAGVITWLGGEHLGAGELNNKIIALYLIPLPWVTLASFTLNSEPGEAKLELSALALLKQFKLRLDRGRRFDDAVAELAVDKSCDFQPELKQLQRDMARDALDTRRPRRSADDWANQLAARSGSGLLIRHLSTMVRQPATVTFEMLLGEETDMVTRSRSDMSVVMQRRVYLIHMFWITAIIFFYAMTMFWCDDYLQGFLLKLGSIKHP